MFSNGTFQKLEGTLEAIKEELVDLFKQDSKGIYSLLHLSGEKDYIIATPETDLKAIDLLIKGSKNGKS